MLHKKKAIGRNRVPWMFIGPAMFFLVIFSIVPIFIAFGASFTDLDFQGLMAFEQIGFAGIDNYLELFQDADFLQTLFNTIIYVIIGVPLVLVLSFVIALLLSMGESKLFESYRVVYYLPYLTNVVAIAVVFTYFFNSEFGLLNYLLGLVGIDSVRWLLEPMPARFTVIILAVWRSLGINIMIFWRQ